MIKIKVENTTIKNKFCFVFFCVCVSCFLFFFNLLSDPNPNII